MFIGDEQFRMSVDVRMPSNRTGGSFAYVAYSFHTTYEAEIESVFPLVMTSAYLGPSTKPVHC
jgi:hypothetical protein